MIVLASGFSVLCLLLGVGGVVLSPRQEDRKNFWVVVGFGLWLGFIAVLFAS